MDISTQILSDITVYMKYAKYIPELERRETWEELVTRNKQMHQKQYPKLKKEIEDAYKMVYDKNSPLLKEARKPPLKFVKYHNYGLKKLRRNKRGYN